jgi:tRNA pseudouridine55 synthase
VARDAGVALGVGAHLTALRRTGVGGFRVDGALAPAALDDGTAVESALITPLEALAHLPVRELSEEERRRVGHGQRLAAEGQEVGLLALVAGAELVAVAESDGRTIRPRKVFA